MTSKTYRVVVMTYRRKKFRALKLLEKDDKLELWLAIRREEFDTGFYDEPQFKHPRLHFMLLNDCIDAGDTRQKIIDRCYEDHIDYCIQLDDSCSRLWNPFDPSKSICDCIEDSINEIETDEHEDKIISMQFLVYVKKHHHAIKYHYHTSNMQAFMIRVKKLMEETNVRFRCCKDVGFDDACFSYDLHINGWATIKSKSCYRNTRTWAPIVKKKGGTHVGHASGIAEQVKRNNERHHLLYDFLTNTYHANNCTLKPLYRTVDGVRYDYLSIHFDWDDSKIIG